VADVYEFAKSGLRVDCRPLQSDHSHHPLASAPFDFNLYQLIQRSTYETCKQESSTAPFARHRL
jgi:hypothetical protein